MANKTYIEFILKLISGIVGVGLNIWLIPGHGLVGVGIATLAANLLYFLLSITIVLPDLRLKLPAATIIKMILAAIPAGAIYYAFNALNVNNAIIEMCVLLFLFYCFYWFAAKLFSKMYKLS